MTQRPPHLRAVDGTASRSQPDGNYYKLAFYTAIITALGSIVATLGVRWAIERATRRGRAQEAQEHPSLAPLTSGPVGLPPGGTFVYYPPTQSRNPWLELNPENPQFPAALSMPVTPRPRRPIPNTPANDSMPPWFAGWAEQFAKMQDKRFRRIEAELAGDDDDEEYEDAG
jgi:hypothetical protein